MALDSGLGFCPVGKNCVENFRAFMENIIYVYTLGATKKIYFAVIFTKHITLIITC